MRHLDRVARHPDDTLDERDVAPVLLVSRGRRENDHVAALVVAEVGRQLVNQHVLARVQGVLHGFLEDLVRLRHEVLDDEEDEQGEDNSLDNLEETAAPAWTHPGFAPLLDAGG